MGNMLSKKVENNGEILGQAFRNAKGAALLGLIFTLLKFKRSIIRIYRSFVDKNKIKNDEQQSKQSIHTYKGDNVYKAMLAYFIKFPAFIALFSILFKKLIRMNYLSTAMAVNLSSLAMQKFSISFMAFLLAHYTQQNVNIFHWKWSLFLLIRSLFGLIRLSVPSQYQIFEIEHLHSVILPLMGCLMVCYYSRSLPASVIATYNAVLYFDPAQFASYFASNHRVMPSCSSTVTYHEHKDEANCFKAMLKDALFIKLPHCASFFVKLHSVAAMFGGAKFIKDLKKRPLTLFWRILRNTMQSCLYWVVGVHFCIRICSCFSRKIVFLLYRVLDNIMGTKNDSKFECCNEKNIYLLMSLIAIVGRYNILSEPKGRRIEITLSLLWYVTVQILRKQCGLETNDNDKYHWLLGSNSFVSFILAAAVGINVYVFCKDAKYVKSMERNIIQKYLIE